MKLFPFDKFIQKYKVRGYFQNKINSKISKKKLFLPSYFKIILSELSLGTLNM